MSRRGRSISRWRPGQNPEISYRSDYVFFTFRVSSTYSLLLNEKLKKLEDSVVKSEKTIKSTKEVGNDYDTINKQNEEHQVNERQTYRSAVILRPQFSLL
jgi:hypothetical protein